MVDHTILVMGGDDKHVDLTDTIFEYTPATNKWRTLPWRLPAPVSSFGAIYDPGSRTLMIAGGFPNYEEDSPNQYVWTRTQPFTSNEWIRGTHQFHDSCFGYC